MSACARATAAVLVSLLLAACVSIRETYTVGDHITVDARNGTGTISGARSIDEAWSVAADHCRRPWIGRSAPEAFSYNPNLPDKKAIFSCQYPDGFSMGLSL